MNCDQALIKLVETVNQAESNKTTVIAVDGRCASGKTTFAKKLSELLSCPVIHTDDFYRPRDESGNLALSEFEGNFDKERFKREVADNLKTSNRFSYGVFDCSKGCVTNNIIIENKGVCIVEGAYSLCPFLGDYADIKVFYDISPEFQQKRILLRGGPEQLETFNNIWIPAEERYHKRYNIMSTCDFIIKAKE